MNKAFGDAAYWSDAWRRHIDRYLSAPPRTGYWIARRFSNELSFLEIAGGSCRDSRYLSSLGRRGVGSDFDENTLAYVRSRFPESSLVLRKEDAFALSFPDKSFDISFSNGFWILFSDDDQLVKLLREQARVTRKHIIIIVHNGDNEKLVQTFAKKATTDSLYDIRFFRRDEVASIVRKSGLDVRSIDLCKFGGPMDRLYRPKLKGLPNPLRRIAPFVVPRLYELQSWPTVERIACVLTLS